MSDPTPFDQVYEQYLDRVYRFCLWQVSDTALAEDIAAQTFMAAYAGYAKRAPEPELVQLWLFRIARNLVSDHRRREKRRQRILQIFGHQARPTSDAEQVVEANAEVERVLHLMTKMKERDRRLIALRAAGELSYREIGALLGMSETAATAAGQRALERFRKLAQEHP